jgi:hypothetical protein
VVDAELARHARHGRTVEEGLKFDNAVVVTSLISVVVTLLTSVVVT